jgi:hypothetical protein
MIARALLMILLICPILYWAENSIPMGGLLVFLLTVSILLTWVALAMLKDKDLLSNMFED